MRGKRSSMMLAVLVAIGSAGHRGIGGGRRSLPTSRRERASPRRCRPAAWRIGGASFRQPIPPGGNPAGVGDTADRALPGRWRRRYAVLSTGDATQADQPDQAGSSPTATTTATPPAGRGDAARDVTVLAIPISVPAGANCLSFDFRFLSEEYPDFVDSSSTTPSSPSSTPRPGPRRRPDDHRPRERLRARPRWASRDDQLDRAVAHVGAPTRPGTPFGGATRTAARQDGGDARRAHRLPVDLRSGRQRSTTAPSSPTRCARATSRRRHACAARRPSARGSRSPARRRLHLADALPDADRHGRRRAWRRPHRDRPHLRRRRTRPARCARR